MLLGEHESRRLRYRLRRERYAERSLRPDGDGGPDPEMVQELAALRDQNEQLTTEGASLRDRALRARAELDNARKRFQREKAEQAKFAAEKVVRELVVVVDNLERACDSAEGIEEAKPLHDGVAMVLDQFLGVLKANGLEVVESDGQVFDPHIHEAVAMEERDDVDANTVIDTLQKGYSLRGRIVRPAMVRVAKAVSRPEAVPVEVDTEAEAVAEADKEDTLADLDTVDTETTEESVEPAAQADEVAVTAAADHDPAVDTVPDDEVDTPPDDETEPPSDDDVDTPPDVEEVEPARATDPAETQPDL